VFVAAVRRPDILHIHAIGPAIVTPVARLLGLRVVVTHHGPDYDRDKWGSFARWVLRTSERLGMRYANRRIAISRVIQNSLKVRYGVDSDLIPNGVSLPDLSTNTDALQSLGIDSGRYVLQVSRMVPEKRQLDLIRAFQEARPAGWKLVLVGGLDKSAYCNEVREAAHRGGVVLTGFLTGSPLQQIYSNAGIFVLPSSHEGLPIAMLEALSFGLPVIASDIAANLEIGLADSSYFPLGDIGALAARLVHCVALPRSVEEREATRSHVLKHYDWDAIAVATVEVYKRARA
jgi:glycosyltransferase involved in cell wall biosynthesis